MEHKKAWTKPENADRRLQGRAWQLLRKRLLTANPLCVECQRQGRVTAATSLDHIIPRSKGGNEDPANLQGLCADCHRDKTVRDRGHRVTYGCDASGIRLDPNHPWNKKR